MIKLDFLDKQKEQKISSSTEFKIVMVVDHHNHQSWLFFSHRTFLNGVGNFNICLNGTKEIQHCFLHRCVILF